MLRRTIQLKTQDKVGAVLKGSVASTGAAKLVLAMFMLPVAVPAADNPFVGTWKLNGNHRTIVETPKFDGRDYPRTGSPTPIPTP